MEATMKKPIADKPVYQDYIESDMSQDRWKEKDMNKVNPPLPGLTDPIKYIEKEYPPQIRSFMNKETQEPDLIKQPEETFFIEIDDFDYQRNSVERASHPLLGPKETVQG